MGRYRKKKKKKAQLYRQLTLLECKAQKHCNAGMSN